MVISSLIVKTLNSFDDSLLNQLNNITGVSVEGVENGDIILVLECDLVNDAIEIIEKEISTLPGVTGVYPVYIAMDPHYAGKEA